MKKFTLLRAGRSIDVVDVSGAHHGLTNTVGPFLRQNRVQLRCFFANGRTNNDIKNYYFKCPKGFATKKSSYILTKIPKSQEKVPKPPKKSQKSGKNLKKSQNPKQYQNSTQKKPKKSQNPKKVPKSPKKSQSPKINPKI